MEKRALDLLGHIDQFIEELSRVKSAADLSKDPGTQHGSSSHPSAKAPWKSVVKDVPDTDDYGARADEHEEDMRKSLHGDSATNFAEKAKNDGESTKDYPGEGPELTEAKEEPELNPEKTTGDQLPSSYKEGIEGKKIAFAKLAERLTSLGDQIIQFVNKEVEECADCPGFDEAFDRGAKVAEAADEIGDELIAEVLSDTIHEAKVAADLTANALEFSELLKAAECAPDEEPAEDDEHREVRDLEKVLDEIEGAGEEGAKKEAADDLFLKILGEEMVKAAIDEALAADPAEVAGDVEPEGDEDDLAEVLSEIAEEEDIEPDELEAAMAGVGEPSEEDIAEAIATLAAEEGVDLEDVEPEEGGEVEKLAADLLKLAALDEEQEGASGEEGLEDEALADAKRAEAFEQLKSELMNDYIRELIRLNRL